MIEEPLDTAPRSGGIKFSDAVMFLWRRWKLIALIFLGVVVLNLLMLLQTAPRYTATSEMTLIDPRQQSSPIADLLTGVPLSRQVVEQEITTIRSKAFMIEVVKRLGVDETSPLLQGGGPPPLPMRMVSGMKRFVSGALQRSPPPSEESVLSGGTTPGEGGESEAAEGQSDGQIKEADDNVTLSVLAADLHKYGPAADLLSSRLMVNQLGNGYVVGVSAEAATPEYAALIANVAAAEYTRFSLRIRSEAIEEQVQLLSGRVEELGQNLEEAETAVVDFQSSAAGLSAASVDRTEGRMAELGRSLMAVRAEIANATARVGKLRELVEAEGPLGAAEVFDSEILRGLRARLSDYRIERSRLQEQFGPDASQVAALNAVIARVEQEAALETDRIAAELETQISIGESVVDSIEESIAALDADASARSRSMVELAKLRRIADANRIAYEEFLKVATESAQLKALQQPSVRLLSYAEVPSAPSSPRTLMRTAASGVAGLLIGLGVALFMELTDNSVKTARDMRKLTGLPVIGSFSKTGGLSRKSFEAGRATSGKPLSRKEKVLVQEGQKVALFLSSVVDAGKGTVLFTSAVPGEGKSGAAMLVAHALASSDHSVILVDAAQNAPLQRPAKPAAEGETGAPSGVTRTTAGYDFLSLADAADTDIGHLSERWTGQLLKKLEERYDWVIIETTPVLTLGNVSSFQRHSDAVVVATQWNATARQTVEACIQELVDMQAQRMFVVMTQVDRNRQRKYEYRGFKKTVAA
ncbi:hypothetical protein AYJ57_23230 (plasmid) [Salipiger sp. CCB-MM3]|uniref:GumC family protein n=1 Tax=Salipiger sp. CCB-MM3 TaxID=1792508 RepID=UPI00080AAE3E|nr:exopolysaccharide transport family protein [Salipiger sp. CCB-MM3]ANT63399.1 hypothetical protein AYJ57_23230 [Salipiger sp. CCB-MM3]